MAPVVEFLTLTAISGELLLLSLALMVIFSIFLFPGGLAWATTRPKSLEAIPGPFGAPLAGAISVFTDPKPHVALSRLARAFNAIPLMAFSVGLSRFVISSDPATAKEILSSSAFADRPVKESAYELLFHRAMGFAPYGEYWRSLRRIASTHLFSPSRIDAFEVVRVEVGVSMVQEVKREMERNGKVKVRSVLHYGSLNNVMRTVFGKSYDFSPSGNGLELDELVDEGYQLLSIFNLGDHFPFLRFLDLHGVRKRCRILASKVNVFVSKIIEEHRARRGSENLADFVDILLDMEDDHKLATSDMVAILWEMIFRGTDTVAILLEWAIARMVVHPEIQRKVQEEIDSVVGKSRAVSGFDTRSMPYLQAVVKETLRVHPPGPLLSWARLAAHDVYVGDKHIPAGTTAMVNMWSITHDERFWADPHVFDPERFIAQDVNILGSDLRLAPFGSGRRVCPGKTMALATAHLWFAQLLQTFKWVPADADVDLTEKLNLSMEMQTPLVCRAVLRND